MSSCRKLVEVDTPPTATSGETVFSSDMNATALMTGVFFRMAEAAVGTTGAFNGFLPVYCGLSSDEMSLFGASNGASDPALYYRNQLVAGTGTNNEMWPRIYGYIYVANTMIRGISASNTLSANVSQQLLGEAKFIRAYNYFYLAALWGDVPVTTTTIYTENEHVLRSPRDSVFDFVVADLKEAIGLLSDRFLAYDLSATTEDRVRPTKHAARALLARVYLYRHMYAEAAQEATLVIDQHALFDTVPLQQTFLKNSEETIWALPSTSTYINTSQGQRFVLPSSGVSENYPYTLSPMLVDSFEMGDKRFQEWVGKWTDASVTPNKDYYYCNKYKVGPGQSNLLEYEVELRLAEQYLIRAEARAYLGAVADGAADLDVIRKRAGLPFTTAATSEELLQAVWHERLIEFFFEGQRWLDLKRTGNVDAVMSVATPLKTGVWHSYQQLYPVSTAELRKVNGLTQNEGY